MGKKKRSSKQPQAPLEYATAGVERDLLSAQSDLSVYQAELAAQNDALIRAQAALEESRDRFVDLYDLAPTGYMTLDHHGLILQCNLTAAMQLGKAKSSLEGLTLIGFVAADERSRCLQFLRRCRRAPLNHDVEDEFTLRTPDGPRATQLLCRRRTIGGGNGELFLALVDVSERRALERERNRIAAEHAALVRRLLAAQDEERQRIARNLHDDIGQQHTVIRMKLEHLAQHAQDEPMRQMIAELRDAFARLDQRVHFVATELRPAALDLGLPNALGQFVREWSETFSVPATFDCPRPEARLAPNVETQLYRIAQEALNNVSKHAAARNVCVLLEHRKDGAVLIVEDDGCGFDASAGGASARLGLAGMRERAQIIGARVDIESSPGRGTSVFVHVPPR